MDIIVPRAEGGERDLTVEEINRRAFALLGARASTYKRNPKKASAHKLCVVAVFIDDDMLLSPPERDEVVLGEGASFAEAFARAEGAVAQRHVVRTRPDGRAEWIDLAAIDIRPVLA